jgi:hypothetical protein
MYFKLRKGIVANNRVETILEQTSFLVDKQNELFQVVKAVYTDILNTIEKKIIESSDQDVLSDLNVIKEKILTHYNSIHEQIEQDIEFLGEQLKAISQIKEMEDKDKADELLNMLISKDEELLNTEHFKKKMNEDAQLSVNELKAMQDDLLNSLKENKIKELKLLLEAVKEHEADLDAGCSDDTCSSCSGCSANPNPQSQDSDIFEFFNEQIDNKDDKEEK